MKIQIPGAKPEMEALEGEQEAPETVNTQHTEMIKKAISEIDTNPEGAKATLSELLKGEEQEVGEPQTEEPKGFRESMKGAIKGMM